MNTIKDMDTIVLLQSGSVQVILHQDTHDNDHTFTNRRLIEDALPIIYFHFILLLLTFIFTSTNQACGRAPPYCLFQRSLLFKDRQTTSYLKITKKDRYLDVLLFV